VELTERHESHVWRLPVVIRLFRWVLDSSVPVSEKFAKIASKMCYQPGGMEWWDFSPDERSVLQKFQWYCLNQEVTSAGQPIQDLLACAGGYIDRRATNNVDTVLDGMCAEQKEKLMEYIVGLLERGDIAQDHSLVQSLATVQADLKWWLQQYRDTPNVSVATVLFEPDSASTAAAEYVFVGDMDTISQSTVCGTCKRALCQCDAAPEVHNKAEDDNRLVQYVPAQVSAEVAAPGPSRHESSRHVRQPHPYDQPHPYNTRSRARVSCETNN